jgi:hypothetical protein
MRWAAAKIFDDIMTNWVTIIDTLVSDGATQIVVSTCPPVQNNLTYLASITGASSAQLANTVNQWNTKLEAAVSSISQVHVFDLYSAMSSIWSNPIAYGFYNMDGQLVSDTISPPNDVSFADEVHPSAALHTAISVALFSSITSWIPRTSQTAPQFTLAAQVLNANGSAGSLTNSPSAWVAGNGFSLWLPANGNYVPLPIYSADQRLVSAASLDRPHVTYRSLNGFDTINGYFSATLPDTSWESVTSGGGQSLSVPGTDYFALGQIGTWLLQTIYVNDSAGIIKNQVPVLIPSYVNGYVRVTCNFALTYGSITETVVFRFGLADALSNTTRPQNGIWIEILNTNGTLTGLLVYASAGSYTTAAFTVPTITNNAKGGAMELVSDYTQTRWFLTWKGSPITLTSPTYPGYTKFPALPVPTVLCLFAQNTNTVSNDTGSGLWIDDLDFVLRNRIP